MAAPSISVSITIPAHRADVWEDVARLEAHPEWMADADAIEFLTAVRAGAGTRMLVKTKVGPLRTKDVMTFTAWDPPERMAVRHEGIFKGTGEFLLDELGPRSTRFTWRERIEFPWFLGGVIGAWAARPVLTAIWRRNLRRLRARFTG